MKLNDIALWVVVLALSISNSFLISTNYQQNEQIRDLQIKLIEIGVLGDD